MSGEDDLPTFKEIELTGRVIMLENEVQTQRRHADRWQQLAGRYDDIRYALRNCEDTATGHAEFYNECSKLIFGDECTCPPGAAAGLVVRCPIHDD